MWRISVENVHRLEILYGYMETCLLFKSGTLISEYKVFYAYSILDIVDMDVLWSKCIDWEATCVFKT